MADNARSPKGLPCLLLAVPAAGFLVLFMIQRLSLSARCAGIVHSFAGDAEHRSSP